MKKVLAVILVAVMALSLVACGSKKDFTGTWKVSTVEGKSIADAKEELASELGSTYADLSDDFKAIVDGALNIELTLTDKTLKITMMEQDSDEIEYKKIDGGFEATQDGQTVTGKYDEKNDVLSLTMDGSAMEFKRK